MKITLDVPSTVMAATLTIICGESTYFTIGAYNISPDEIRDGAIINIPGDRAEESPDSDHQGCWRVENVDDVRRADQVVPCEDCQFWQRHTQVNRDYGKCERFGTVTTRRDDFCSLGMKKSDE